MKTKDVLLVLGGVAVGYFAYKMNWFQKSKNLAPAYHEIN